MTDLRMRCEAALKPFQRNFGRWKEKTRNKQVDWLTDHEKRFIEAASPEVVLTLIKEADVLRNKLARWSKQNSLANLNQKLLGMEIEVKSAEGRIETLVELYEIVKQENAVLRGEVVPLICDPCQHAFVAPRGAFNLRNVVCPTCQSRRGLLVRK